MPPADRMSVHRAGSHETSLDLPGVTTAAASAISPVHGLGLLELVHVPGVPPSFEPGTNGRLGAQATYLNVITPGWFATYGTPIKVGRDFNDGDVKGAPSSIIVNEAFVQKFLPDTPPVGASLAFERGAQRAGGPNRRRRRRNAAYNTLRVTDVPIAYVPLAQNDFPLLGDATISVRAAVGSPMLMVRTIAAALTAVDPDLVFGFRPIRDQVSASLTQERLTAMLAGFFGLLALLLAGLGLYGMTAYAVACRRTEIGIRIALGSTGAGVVRLVVVRAAAPIVVGILIGVGTSVWASKFIATLLFGLTARDPLTLAGAVATLVIVGIGAAWLPAYRASRLDPATVLRAS